MKIIVRGKIRKILPLSTLILPNTFYCYPFTYFTYRMSPSYQSTLYGPFQHSEILFLFLGLKDVFVIVWKVEIAKSS